MAEFCACGSIVIDGRCTNRNCNIRVLGKSTASGPAHKAGKPAKKETKKSSPRRSSKCVSYNLYEQKEEDT